MRQFLATEPTAVPGSSGTAVPRPGSPARAKQSSDVAPSPRFRCPAPLSISEPGLLLWASLPSLRAHPGGLCRSPWSPQVPGAALAEPQQGWHVLSVLPWRFLFCATGDTKGAALPERAGDAAPARRRRAGPGLAPCLPSLQGRDRRRPTAHSSSLLTLCTSSE